MNLVILSLNTSPVDQAGIARLAGQAGHRFHAARVDVNEIGELPVYRPDIVILDLSGTSGQGQARLIEVIRERCEDAELLLLAEPEQIPTLISRFKRSIREFLQKPVDETALELALARLTDRIALNARLRQLESTAEHLGGPDVNELLETERFIIIKQLVDKLSYFIGRIARDVEDGVKYYQDTPYFVSIHNCDLKVVANDERYQQYFGNRVGDNSWAVYADKTADPARCPVGKTMQTGMVQRMNAWVHYPGGEKAPVIVHTAPIYNNHGRITFILEVMAGSREINQLRKELRSTRQKYQKLFDEVPDYIAVLDRNLYVTAANRRFKEEFGDQTGSGIFDIFTRRTFSETDFPPSQTLQDGEPHSIETEMITRDGRRFNTILSTAPVTTVTGKLIQVIVIFKDITEKRRLEDHLSTLGLMFTVVSHNIKNILTGLDAGLYHIDRGFYKDIPGEIEEGMEVATLMKERIRKLILDVLYYAKPRELQVERVEIRELVTDVARQIQPKMGARDIAFDYRIDGPAGEFEADREIFRSILLNLLENAMEACMDPHSDRAYAVRLSVSVGEDQVRFDVIDNGAGMEDTQKQQIFSKFYSTKGNKGTGLGLFIAHQVVTQHGGEIRVSSTPGQGSRFTVIMPEKAPASNGRESVPRTGPDPDSPL